MPAHLHHPVLPLFPFPCAVLKSPSHFLSLHPLSLSLSLLVFPSSCSFLLLSLLSFLSHLLSCQLWLRQRSPVPASRSPLSSPFPSDSLTPFLLSLVALHLSLPSGGNRITPQMSPLHFFRALVEALGEMPLTRLHSCPLTGLLAHLLTCPVACLLAYILL